MAGIWGKVIGGVAGFAVGGPLGAVIGAVAGHAVDKMRRDPGAAFGAGDSTESRQAAFAVAMVVLSAKMAKADGQVTRDEINAFRDVFKIPPEEAGHVGRLFDQAKKTSQGFEPYAHQIGTMFAANPAVLEELLGGLIHIAKADGVIHPSEITYLGKVAQIFGFHEADFERLMGAYAGDSVAKDDPYKLLGLDKQASDATIKKTYRDLVRENHPDRLIAAGLPDDFVALAHEKMAAINGAYDEICKRRGLN